MKQRTGIVAYHSYVAYVVTYVIFPEHYQITTIYKLSGHSA